MQWVLHFIFVRLIFELKFHIFVERIFELIAIESSKIAVKSFSARILFHFHPVLSNFPVFFRFFILLSSLHSSVGSFVVEFQLKRDGRKKRNKKNALWPSVSNIIVISIIIGQRSENKCVCVFDSKIGQTEKKKQEILTGIKSVKEDEHTSKKGKPDDKSTRYDCWTRLRGICVFCTNTVLFSSFVEHIE